jgi:hypothetical protein
MSIIPAIVLQIKQLKAGARHAIKVIPVMRGLPPIDIAQDTIPLQINDTSMLSPLPDVHCYAFPRLFTFVCNPD